MARARDAVAFEKGMFHYYREKQSSKPARLGNPRSQKPFAFPSDVDKVADEVPLAVLHRAKRRPKITSTAPPSTTPSKYPSSTPATGISGNDFIIPKTIRLEQSLPSPVSPSQVSALLYYPVSIEYA